MPRLDCFQDRCPRYKAARKAFTGQKVMHQDAGLCFWGGTELCFCSCSSHHGTIHCFSSSIYIAHTMNALVGHPSSLFLPTLSLYTTLTGTTYIRCGLYERLNLQNTSPEDFQQEPNYRLPVLAQRPTATSVRKNVHHGLPLPRYPALPPT